MNDNKEGYIYILTNPSFPSWVKIGYADDVEERVRVLNSRECTPFAFRIYATYKVNGRLKDIELHNLIDGFNPDLRSKEVINGRARIREFYALSPEAAFEILRKIASINSLEKNLKLHRVTKEELADEDVAEKANKLAANRHHFKEIEFSSSLTNKRYKGTTNEKGTLAIIDLETGNEVPNNSNPSKKAILGQAIIDLEGETDKEETLYQRYHKLTKLVLRNH